jgi:hypothetical protein
VERVSVIDHPQLQDGMSTHWADAAMVEHVETEWSRASYDLVTLRPTRAGIRADGKLLCCRFRLVLAELCPVLAGANLAIWRYTGL